MTNETSTNTLAQEIRVAVTELRNAVRNNHSELYKKLKTMPFQDTVGMEGLFGHRLYGVHMIDGKLATLAKSPEGDLISVYFTVDEFTAKLNNTQLAFLLNTVQRAASLINREATAPLIEYLKEEEDNYGETYNVFHNKRF